MAVSGLKLKTIPAVTVTTAGTRVPITVATTLVYSVTIQAMSTNTGEAYVGDSSVSSTNGIILTPSDTMEIDAPAGARGVDQFDLSKIYIDSSTNGATFRIVAWIRE